MSDLAKALEGKKEEKAPQTRLAKMLSALEEFRSDAQALRAQVPPVVDEYAGMASRWMPGVGALDSVRMGSEASGMWREGRYADALDRYADALHAPINEVLWFAPGGGVVKKVAR